MVIVLISNTTIASTLPQGCNSISSNSRIGFPLVDSQLLIDNQFDITSEYYQQGYKNLSSVIKRVNVDRVLLPLPATILSSLSSSINLWLDASTLTYTNGQNVTTWNSTVGALS